MLECPDATGDAADFLRLAHRRPAPAVEAGQMLAEAGIRTAMDVSDGLVDDLGKLCAASGIAAVIHTDQIPAHPYLKRQFPGEYLGMSLGGGEDYVLLFTGPEEVVRSLLPRVGEGASVIGEMVAIDGQDEAGKVTVVGEDGSEVSLTASGWDHFGGL